MKNPNIHETFNYLKRSYLSVDFRCAYFKEDGEWKSIVSIFRFTNKSNEEVIAYHTKLNSHWENTENFKIELKSINHEEWEEIWKEKVTDITDLMKNIDLSNLEPRRNLKRSHTGWISKVDLEYNSIQYNVLITNHNEHHKKFQFFAYFVHVPKLGPLPVMSPRQETDDHSSIEIPMLQFLIRLGSTNLHGRE